jgi:hypothetical protein
LCESTRQGETDENYSDEVDLYVGESVFSIFDPERKH